MKTEAKRKYRFFLQLIGSCVLIIAGMIFIGRAFGEYGQIFLRSQDEQLYHLAQAVDRNINSLLDRCEKNLDYVIKRRGFLEAQQIWVDTGETEDLLFRMEENIVAQDEMIKAILAIKDGKVFLSTDGALEYTAIGRGDDNTFCSFKDGKGNIYLAFLCEADDGISYAALMNLNHFYHQIVGDHLNDYDWVILTDATREILLYQQKGALLVEAVDAVSSATCGLDGVDILLSKQEQQIIDTSSYEYMDETTKENYTARMVVIPTAESENGTFAIGVVTNFEKFIEPLNRSAFQMICYCCMIVAGVLLLLYLVMRFRKRNERDLRELQILREKNEAMAILNEQTRELAHHQRLETIGTLTSSIAHEFNNLLTPIMGYSILTLEQLPPDKEELYDNILEIYQASCRARDITSQLSRLSCKNAPSAFAPIKIDELVKKVLHVAVPSVPSGVEVETSLEGGAGIFEGNETQISQMILNLVLNGFQAMEEKGGTLKVSTYSTEELVVISVQDEGMGIPKEHVKNIYEPFFTTKETGKGTGLGLAIVQQVVSEHQGHIRLNTKEGKGSVFIVEFPRKK